MNYPQYKKFAYTLLALIIFLFGVIIGKGISVPHIEVDPKINLLHIATILNTLFIAVVISIFIDDKKKKDGAQKEIMVKRIDKLVEDIEALQKEVLTGKVGLQYAISIPKRLNQTTRYIWTSIGECKIQTSIAKETIVLSVLEIRKLLTTTPPIENAIQKNCSQATVADDYLIYGTVVITQLMSHIEKLKNNLFKAQIDIHSN